MRSATIMTALCAGLALAGPIVKKALVTHYVTVYDYVYVTAGAPPVSVTTQPHAHPKPTTSEAVVVKPTISEAPAPVVVEPTPTPVAATASAAPVAPPVSSGSFEDIVLYHHNIHRANNSVDPLIHDERIAGYARTVAATCKYGHDLSPGGGGYGQNIAVYGTTANPIAIGDKTSIAQAITNMWYDGEVDLFPKADYGKPTPDMTNFEVWGHYSQIVWKSTTGVGCAAQFCEKGTVFSDLGSWFTVCNYFTAGNVGGAYGDNVFPPLGHPSISA